MKNGIAPADHGLQIKKVLKTLWLYAIKSVN